jgi:hypothetical protein
MATIIGRESIAIFLSKACLGRIFKDCASAIELTDNIPQLYGDKVINSNNKINRNETSAFSVLFFVMYP